MTYLRHMLAIAVGLLVGVVGLALPAQAVANRDCSDFRTQQAAQDFFLAHGGPRRDPHRLDSDGDGVACETLPCPCGASSQPGPRPGGTKVLRQRGNVVEVVDGDTVKVRLLPGRKVRSVRLIGVDTPEVFGTEECYGPEASAELTELLPVGSRVRLVSDPTQDRVDAYGRLLRYVSKGGVDAGRHQLEVGAAEVYVYDDVEFQRVADYRAAQSAAEEADLGRWGACEPVV